MSTEPKHTPLPWAVGSSNEVFSYGDEGEAFSEWLKITGADGEVICELPGHSQFARGSDKLKAEDANAELIVNAVNSHDKLKQERDDLLAALKAVLGDFHSSTVVQARQAIANATA